jgi:glucose/arabinose dehydrogenase
MRKIKVTVAGSGDSKEELKDRILNILPTIFGGQYNEEDVEFTKNGYLAATIGSNVFRRDMAKLERISEFTMIGPSKEHDCLTLYFK